MSGGSHSYICWKIEEELVGQMRDAELDDLMKDIAELAHDLEWADSGDYAIEDYFNSVKKFKAKWFHGNRTKRLQGYIDKKLNKLHDELLVLIGAKEYEYSEDDEE